MLGITTSLQNTDIPRFQAKRKNVEGYIGTGFVDNADDSERYRYFSMRMPLGLSNEANILPNGEGSPATFLISEVIPKIRSRESALTGRIWGLSSA